MMKPNDEGLTGEESKERLAERAKQEARQLLGRLDLHSPAALQEAFATLLGEKFVLERAHKQLEHRYDRYLELYHQAPFPYATLNEKGFILEANEATATLFGLAASALIMQPLSRFVHKEDLDIFSKQRKKLLKSAAPQVCELRLLKESGACFWVRLEAILGQDAGEPVSRISLIEITSYKRSEVALRESEHQKAAILNGIKTNITLVDKDLKILWGNRAASLSVDKKPEELQGHTCHFFWGDPDKPCDKCPTVQALSTRQSEQATVQTLDGRWWDERAEPLLDGDGQVIAVVEIAHEITEQKRAEERIKRQQYYLEKAQELGKIGTWELDLNRNKLFWTDENCRIFGVPAGSVVNYEVFLSKVHPDDRDYVDYEWRKALEGKPYEIEHRLLINGITRWVREKADLFFDEAGKAQRAIGFTQEITDRKEAQAELRAKSLLLENIINSSDDYIFVKDAQLRLVICNETFARALGKEQAELQGKTDIECGWDPEFVKGNPEKGLIGFEQNDREALAGKTIHSVSEPANVLGEVRIFDTTKLPLRNSQGRISGVLGVARDITERKQAEDALRESEERFQQLFDHMADGVAIYEAVDEGRDFVFVDMNETGQKLSKVVLDDVLGRRVTEVFSAVEEIGLLEVFRQVWRSGEPAQHPLSEYVDGRISQWVENYVYKLPSGLIVAIYSDISEQKLNELEKARLEGQLQQAQKMESVGRLAGGVAHDFNNMLGVILGNVEMALEQVDPQDQLYADLQEIKKAGDRSADLTRQLLAFARKQTIAPKVLNLNETVASMLKMLQRLIGEDIVLNWRPGANLWPVRVDPSQVDQILANLCVNARDAISGHGRIVIETKNTAFDESYCANHAGFLSGEYARLVVSDSGCGMDKKMQEHVFEPFFTTKGVGKGTGLGLATVYGAVKQNNGFIQVSSAPGSGTRFSIYFPRYLGGGDQAQGDGDQRPHQRAHETILLVEDEPAMLKLIATMLEKQGYTVFSAVNPGEAIRLAKEHAGKIHLLMTDVIMPEMNGRDLATKLLALYPEMKRLFMSGYTAEIIAHRGVLDKDVYFIQKPFSNADLVIKVREALEEA